MRKFLKITTIVIGSLLLLAAVLFVLIWKMSGTIQSACDEITPLMLQDIPDGVYRGSAGEFIITVDLSVSVKDHRIESIKIDNQLCSSKHKALDTIDRIVEKQSAEVDATAGATWSSKSIMAATYRALEKK
jgi:uncharacterized protein with FMN-binding domain